MACLATLTAFVRLATLALAVTLAVAVAVAVAISGPAATSGRNVGTSRCIEVWVYQVFLGPLGAEVCSLVILGPQQHIRGIYGRGT